jgi:uncharacterized repeat protein (TIGR03803 family)
MLMNSLHRRTKMKPRTAAFALTVLTLLALFAGVAISAQAQIPQPTVLHTFQNAPTDAASPYGAIAQGRDGNLYGTGVAAGPNHTGGVFKITPSGVETLLVSFPSNWTSCNGLTLGMDGTFYGTRTQSGTLSKGLIYRVTPAGVLTDLHNFRCSAGDCYPYEAPPVLGPDGNFYGSTGNPNYGGNSIYRITAAGVYKNLYTMSGGNRSPLAFGSDGNIYGTVADAAGFGNVGGVFRITTGGTFKILFRFCVLYQSVIPKHRRNHGERRKTLRSDCLSVGHRQRHHL